MHWFGVRRAIALGLAAVLCGGAVSLADPAQLSASEVSSAAQSGTAAEDIDMEFRAGVFTSYAGFIGNQLVPSDQPGVDYEFVFDDSVTEKDFEDLSDRLGTEVTPHNNGVIYIDVDWDNTASDIHDYTWAGAVYSTNPDVVAASYYRFGGFSTWGELLATGPGTADVWITYSVYLDDGDEDIDGYVTKVIRVTVPDDYELHEDERDISGHVSPIELSGFEPEDGEGVTRVTTDVAGTLVADEPNNQGANLVWSSSDPSILTVDQDGNIKAQGKEGLVVIRVEEDGECSDERAYRLFEVSGPETMHRLYNRWTGEHFYTASAEERDSLVGVGWTDEGTGWVAPGAGRSVYRLYNPYVEGGDHHYTMDEEEYEELAKLGWRQEGVGWYSDASEAVPVYRQYNPFATTGTHNYTIDKHENDELVRLGWREEGIGWYAVEAD